MATFESMPTSVVNQDLLDNIAKVSKENNINPKSIMKFAELTFMHNLNNIKEIDVKSVQIEPRSGDLIVEVNETNKLTTYRNPQTGQITPGSWLPLAGWKQNNGDVDENGEPVDENGLTKEEWEACQVTEDEFGWCEIIFGRSFWGKPILPKKLRH